MNCRLEVEAKLPRGDWLWPAVWLLPEDDAYGQWPASGEIDMLESRGNRYVCIRVYVCVCVATTVLTYMCTPAAC
jgi:Glycosyl hydrolases family 16